MKPTALASSAVVAPNLDFKPGFPFSESIPYTAYAQTHLVKRY